MSELAVNNGSARGANFKAGLKRYGSAFKYLFFVLLHPFKGFWELKHDKKGHLGVGFTVLALYILTDIFFQQFGGFSFNIMAAYPYRVVLRLSFSNHCCPLKFSVVRFAYPQCHLIGIAGVCFVW